MPYVSHIDYRKLVEENGKRCPACGHKKAAVEFSLARDRHDGRAGHCRVCVKQRYGATKRRYEKSAARKVTKASYHARHPLAAAQQNKRYRALKRFRAVTVAMDRLYPSHFVRNS